MFECIITNKKQNEFLLFKKRSPPAQDDVLTAGGGDKDVSLLTGLVHGGDLITCTATGHEDTFSSVTGRHIMILKYQKLATFSTKGVIKTISFPIHSTLYKQAWFYTTACTISLSTYLPWQPAGR